MRLLADPPPLSNPNFLVATNHIFSLLRQPPGRLTQPCDSVSPRQAPAALRFRQTPAGFCNPAIQRMNKHFCFWEALGLFPARPDLFLSVQSWLTSPPGDTEFGEDLSKA